MSAQPTEPIRCSTVEISEDSVSEYDRNVKILSFPIKNMHVISLEQGSPVERPIVQIFIGIMLLAMGIGFGVWPLFDMFSKNDLSSNSYSLWPFAFAVPLILIGFWFLTEFFQKRYFLLIETEKELRKIVFDTNVSDHEVRLFVDRANRLFGLNISRGTR